MRTISQGTMQCLECNVPLKGRIDKKFCCDQCRSTYHNRTHRKENAYMRRLDRQLKKNRLLLKNLLARGLTKINTKDLILMGFNWAIMTGFNIDSTGAKVIYCYDYGLKCISTDEVEVFLLTNSKLPIFAPKI